MTIRILAVCTGNICRSPMAEALLRAGAAEVGLDAQIASVGSWESGVAADPHAISVMSDRGLDITGHLSHKAAVVDIEAADLILTMAVEHIVDVAGQVPEAFTHAFTLKEFVARARELGPKDQSLTLDTYLGLLGDGRSRTEMLRADERYDIGDPLGQGRRAFERTATELEVLVWAAVDLLVGYPARS